MSKKNDVLTYEDYVEGIGNLKPEQQLHLVELLTATLKKQIGRTSGKRKITELDGLGAEVWKNIEIQDYIQKERNSWD
ncbi:MAG: hypothetical protein U5K72_14495 [Balneolaceae bacterium]|nr:hypothetical protein [Balneolaceae bacterium]